MLQLKLPHGTAAVLLALGVALSIGALAIYPNGVDREEPASGMLITFLGVLLTSESILILIASGGFPRWPSIGRILKHSGFYVVLILTGTATAMTTIGHILENYKFLVSGLVFWALAGLAAGGSLALLLFLSTKSGRTWLLRKELAAAIERVSKGEYNPDAALISAAITDYLAAVQDSTSSPDGGDISDLIDQLCFAKTKPRSYPAYDRVEMEVVRIIFRAVVAGNLSPEVSERALSKLMIRTKSPKRQFKPMHDQITPTLRNLAWNVHYLSWVEAALLSEYRDKEIGSGALRRTLHLSRSLLKQLTLENSGVGGAKGAEHTNPDHSIGSAAEALVYFSMAGDYLNDSTWYSQYVLYESVTGLRFNGDFFSGRPIMNELAEIVYEQGEQPKEVTEYRQHAGYVSELIELLPDRNAYDAAMTKIFCQRIATAWGRVKGQSHDQGIPHMRIRRASIQSLFRAAGSLKNIASPAEAYRGIAAVLFGEGSQWEECQHLIQQAYSSVSPASSRGVNERMVPLILVFLSRMTYCEAQNSEPMTDRFLAGLDREVLKSIADVLEDFDGINRTLPVNSAIALKMRELIK